MELDENGVISVTGKTAQKRWSNLEFPNITELPMSDVMLFQDRRDPDEPLTPYLKSIVDEIWEEVAEDEPWFSFCVPTYAE
jgi:hypothetical protein